MRNTRYLALILLLVGSGGFAMAAEKGIWPLMIAQNLSEKDYIGEVPRVLTVSRLSHSITDEPSAVTVIDCATIRASGAVDIAELFRFMPGMFLGVNAGFVYNTNQAPCLHIILKMVGMRVWPTTKLVRPPSWGIVILLA